MWHAMSGIWFWNSSLRHRSVNQLSTTFFPPPTPVHKFTDTATDVFLLVDILNLSNKGQIMVSTEKLSEPWLSMSMNRLSNTVPKQYISICCLSSHLCLGTSFQTCQIGEWLLRARSHPVAPCTIQYRIAYASRSRVTTHPSQEISLLGTHV